MDGRPNTLGHVLERDAHLQKKNDVEGKKLSILSITALQPTTCFMARPIRIFYHTFSVVS